MELRHLKMVLDLLSLPTSPGNEGAVIAWVERFVAARQGLTIRRDKWGNLLVRYAGRGAARRPLVFCAHMDHPGFTAQQTEAPGLLRARWNGVVPTALFAGARVRFHSGGHWVRGVIEDVRLAPDRLRVENVTVRARGPVAAGSVGMWDFPDAALRGERIVARGCDDVGGVASLMLLLDEAVRRNASNGFHVFLTRAEEYGFLGAIGACEAGTLPRNAVIVAIECSKALSNAPVGNGPIVRVGDKAAIFPPEVSAWLTAVAAGLQKSRPGFRYQRRLMDGGVCESAVYAQYGYAAGGLCVPLGNYHNVRPNGKSLGAEYIGLSDLENIVTLYLGCIERFGEYGRQGAEFKKRVLRNFRERKGIL